MHYGKCSVGISPYADTPSLEAHFQQDMRSRNHHHVSCKCKECHGKARPRTTRVKHELAERHALSTRGVYSPYPLPSRSQGLSKYSALVRDRKTVESGGESALESFIVLTPRAPSNFYRAKDVSPPPPATLPFVHPAPPHPPTSDLPVFLSPSDISVYAANPSPASLPTFAPPVLSTPCPPSLFLSSIPASAASSYAPVDSASRVQPDLGQTLLQDGGYGDQSSCTSARQLTGSPELIDYS